MVGVVWLEEGTLILETNSLDRADSLRARVEAACGDAIIHRLRDLVDPTSPAAREAAARKGSLDRTESPEDLRRVMAEEKARYYADWLDQTIPASACIGRIAGP